MTHNELLAICDNYSFKDSAEPVKALRAVVELHKPNKVPKGLWCTECSKRFENSGWYEPYPCPTICTIEEQLK